MGAMVPEALAVEVALILGDALAVAVELGEGDKLGDGDGVEHNEISFVQEAPRDGQQYCDDPQEAISPTFATVEQLISLGVPPTLIE
jgi:hypothetical protein